MEIRIKVDIRAFERQLTDIQRRQLPFATARALTFTARDVQKELAEELPRAFDRPTPFTRNAFGFVGATKATLTARVFVKDIQAEYLLPQIEGGKRALKRFEQRLTDIRGKSIAVPGSGSRLDQYGNLSRAQILKLVRKGDKNLIRLPSGVYVRQNKQLVPLLLFASSATYRKRFDYAGIARRTVDRIFQRHFDSSLALALRTAK